MKFKLSLVLAGAALLSLSWVGDVWAQPAFSTAEGMAGAIEGGRGGAVLKVTTLAADGPGSLQAALDTEGPRIIVFDVSGVITADEIIIPHGDVTIAGQTAPGAGITIAGRLSAAYEFGTDNIIIRHLRVRTVDPTGPGEQIDSMQFSRSSRVLLDHVSVAFGVDETIDFFEASDITVQWSTIESSATTGHPEGAHNYGLISGPNGARASIHHNLFAHHQNRCPALATGPSEVRNNVVYNVRHGFVHHNPAAERFAIVGNSYLAGDDDDLFPFFFDDEAGGTDPELMYYLADNYIDDPGVFTGTVQNPWSEPWDHPSFEYLGLSEDYRAEADFDFATLVPDRVAVTEHDALTAQALVLDCAGAWPRDVVTRQVIADTIDRTGSWGATIPPDLLEGLTPTEPLPDADDDGMPDAWELDHGLDPTDGTDHGVVLDRGLTAIEVYLDERAAQLVGDACPSMGEPPGGTDDGADGDSGPGADGTDSDAGQGADDGGPTSTTAGDSVGSESSDPSGSSMGTSDATQPGGCSCRQDTGRDDGPSPVLLALGLWLTARRRYRHRPR